MSTHQQPTATAGSRPYTRQEAHDAFIEHVACTIDYWAGGAGSNVPATYDSRARIQGFAHSMLALLDGCTDLPGWLVVPQPHPDDKAYHEDLGEKFWPPQENNEMDIAGALHEALYGTIERLGLPHVAA